MPHTCRTVEFMLKFQLLSYILGSILEINSRSTTCAVVICKWANNYLDATSRTAQVCRYLKVLVFRRKLCSRSSQKARKTPLLRTLFLFVDNLVREAEYVGSDFITAGHTAWSTSTFGASKTGIGEITVCRCALVCLVYFVLCAQ